MMDTIERLRAFAHWWCAFVAERKLNDEEEAHYREMARTAFDAGYRANGEAKP